VPAVRVLIDYLAEHFKFRQHQRPQKKKADTIPFGKTKSRLTGVP
jgi:hypothetical protein